MVNRITDFTVPGLDLVFLSNGWVAGWSWDHDDTTGPESHRVWLDSLEACLALWRPEELRLTCRSMEFGALLGEAQALTVPIGLEGSPREQVLRGLAQAGFTVGGEADGDFALASAEGGLAGWHRLALPDGIETAGDWSGVCTDGLGPRSVELAPAPALHGRPSVWARLADAQTGGRVALVVETLSWARLDVVLGQSFFNAAADPRSDAYSVRGRPLKDWVEVNAPLCLELEAQLAQFRWRQTWPPPPEPGPDGAPRP